MTRLLFHLALLAYPRSFRRRFGAEMWADLERARRGGSTSDVATTVGTLIVHGLAERWSALVRVLFWPDSQPHLYETPRRRIIMWDTFRSDVRHALRLAANAPLVTMLTVLALGLGIGATSAIATIVHGVVMSPLPYRDSDRLVMVWSDATMQGRPRNTLSPANYQDLRRMNGTLEGLEAYFSFVTPFEMVIDGPTEVAHGVTVTPGMFDLLGRAPFLGRALDVREETLEVLLSYGYWQRRFGGNPAVVGRTLQVDNNLATVVGVMPQDFTFPYGPMLGPSGFTRATSIDLWAAMHVTGPIAAANRMLTPQGEPVRSVHWLGAVGRMRPGTTVEHVQADLSTVARQLEQRYPDSNTGWGATVVPVMEQTIGTIRGPLYILLAGVFTVLLIAAANVANLVLARSIGRQKEYATRVALGAGRARLVRQTLTEGLVLASAGGVLGLLVAYAGVTVLVALAPADLPRLHDVAPGMTVVLITAGAAILTSMLVGLLPALSAARTHPQAALREHSRGAIGGAFRRRARAGLVIAEIALAVALTVAGGLLLRSFVSLLGTDPGFHSHNMLTWQMNLPDRLRSQDDRTAFYREFLDRMRSLPGVVSVGGTTRLPLGSTALSTFIEVDGSPRPEAEWPEVQFRRAIGDYFQTMGIPILAGRTFTDADGASATPVCVVNRTLASKLFPGEDPIGRRVRGSPTQPWLTIIGVIGDIRHGALDEPPLPELYVSHLQGQVVSPFMVLRTAGDATDWIDLVRAEARAIDSTLPVYRIQTMESVRSESVAQRRFLLLLVGFFGALAMILAALGVYGTMSVLVSERTQEVGVRLALGASPAEVVRMLVLQAVRLAGVGALAGVALSLGTMPLLSSQLYGVQPRDPMMLTVVPAVLVLVAVLAAIVPARRAMRIDPTHALRGQ
jgi:putative ABC transport system permease protein